MAITPIDEMERRIPQIGRIRKGYSTEKVSKNNKAYQAPVKSDTWILSSQERSHLDTMAEIYGGEVKSWSDPRTPDTWRLGTTTNVLNVVLPPEPLAVPRYEKWNGGKCEVRCDGRVAIVRKGDAVKDTEIACMCQEIDDTARHCKPKNHLSVMFPETPIGVWRLVSSSRNEMIELGAAVEIIRMATDRGLPNATLRLDFQQSGEKEFYVARLGTKASLLDLEQASLGGAAGRLDSGVAEAPRMQLPAGAEVARIDEDGVMDVEWSEDPPEAETATETPAPADEVVTEVEADAVPSEPNLGAASADQVRPLAEQVTDRFLRFSGPVVKAVREALEEAEFWPLGVVENDAQREEVLAIFDEIDKAEEAKA